MTSLANILAGQRLTAAMLRAVAPLAAYKGADESVTSSTALQNDDALYLALNPDAVYFFACMLDYEGGAQGSSDLKFAWAGPSGFTMAYGLLAITPGGGSSAGYLRGPAGASCGTTGTGNRWSALMTGSLTTGGSPGTLQLQWAQNTSSGTATVVHAGSVLAAWQIA